MAPPTKTAKAAKAKLPRRLTLPTGRVLTLRERAKDAAKEPVARRHRAMFEAAREALLALELADEAGPVAVDALDLRDFHALRAVLARVGRTDEREVEVHCTNCDAAMRVRPSSTFELGPFADGELDDPELDAPFDFGAEHDGVVLRPLTVGAARPLHEALAKGPLDATARLVPALGVVSFDGREGPAEIARHLRECGDDDFARFCDAFTDAHYPRRLFAVHACPSCGARNDVDAPWDRELIGDAAGGPRAQAGAPGFPSFEEFDAAVREEAEGRVPDGVTLVVEGGVPACDDGGVPLLGSYVPPWAGSEHAPSRPGEVTLFYRTFLADWQDHGAYDWRAEVRETIEHELEHHEGHLRGHDPMDEDERAEIARDVARTVGKRELARRGARALFSDWGEFWRRTWPLWIVLLIAVIAVVMFGRSSD